MATTFLGTIGDEEMLPQNMPLWHTDYFELKTLEKKHRQEDLFDAILSTSNQDIISLEKNALRGPGREHSHHKRLGVEVEINLYKQTY